jgi:hypothetical protein
VKWMAQTTTNRCKAAVNDLKASDWHSSFHKYSYQKPSRRPCLFTALRIVAK